MVMKVAGASERASKQNAGQLELRAEAEAAGEREQKNRGQNKP